jgi:glycogen debranching enzyme
VLDDSALRPNQIFAISFKYPVLDPSRWEKVLEAVREKLLTPFGLRTLSPCHPDFQAKYSGDLRSRDAAYHQGTVWPWLIGPFIDAWLKVHPNDYANPQIFLQGLEGHLNHTCVGNIAEIFDATEPYHARGCFAQAWSVAEVLRCLVKVTAVRR